MLKLLGKLHGFAANCSGVAAIEFAYTAPILAALLLGVADYGNIILERTQMQTALRTGAQYLMNDKQDLVAAHDLVMASWSSRPADAVVVADTFCMCGDVVHVCNALCDDNSIPGSFIRLDASATLTGLLSNVSHASQEIVRIR